MRIYSAYEGKDEDILRRHGFIVERKADRADAILRPSKEVRKRYPNLPIFQTAKQLISWWCL